MNKMRNVFMQLIVSVTSLTTPVVGYYTFKGDVTWEDAVLTCQGKNASIEENIRYLTYDDRISSHGFWLPQYTALTPWIAFIGCANINQIKHLGKTEKTSIGLCYYLCSTSNIFAHKNEVCFCLSTNNTYTIKTETCCTNEQEHRSELYNVYSVESETYEQPESGMCKISRCVNNGTVYKSDFSRVHSCNGNYKIGTICENRMRPSYSVFQKNASTECRIHHSSKLPHDSKKLCKENGSKALFNFWLSINRTMFNHKAGYSDTIPAAKSLISCRFGKWINGSYIEGTMDCLARKHVVCSSSDEKITSGQINSTTVSSRPSTVWIKTESTNPMQVTKYINKSSANRTDQRKAMNLGSLIGGIIGGVFVIAVILTVGIIFMKRRSFNQNKPKSTITTNTINESSQIDYKHETAHVSNHAYLYGVVCHESNNVYAKVNKKANDVGAKQEKDSTYMEVPDGAYDSLGDLSTRKKEAVCNLYDTGSGSEYDRCDHIFKTRLGQYDTYTVSSPNGN